MTRKQWLRSAARVPPAWAAALGADVCKHGGALSEGGRAGPDGRHPATEPRLPRLLLGLGQTGSGGPAEGGGRPDPVPEDQQQGGTD